LIPALLIQRMRLRALTAERTAIAERQATLQAQLEALQARTDPHFLFNSLNTVAALIPEDPRQAERALEQLADLFRYALESSRTRAVPLRREVAMISDYLALQSARFGERLRTNIELDEAIADVQVPPLMLQPLVENAILHGMARRRGGEVRVSARKDGDCVVIEVTDDGPGPGASSHSGTGSAISTLSERLRLHYSGRGEIVLHARSDGGCLARMVLPLTGSA
jgi:two-component system sensor histidine kinase AlgZ